MFLPSGPRMDWIVCEKQTTICFKIPETFGKVFSRISLSEYGCLRLYLLSSYLYDYLLNTGVPDMFSRSEVFWKRKI